MATFDVAKLLNKITQDIPGINTVLKALAKWDVSALTDVPDGAMQATTDANNRLTIKKNVSGSYTPVAKLMHDVDKLDGYHASASATANTVAVRNAQGALPGNILGNSATADTADALADGSVVPVDQGGTGATTASQARANLGAAGSSDFTAHIATQASPAVEGHVKLDAFAADGSNRAAPGGFGLGMPLASQIPANTDLDTVVLPGFYSCRMSSTATTITNCPTASAFSMLVEFGAYGPTQTITAYNSGARFQRTKTSSTTFGPWRSLPNGITDSTSTTSSTIAASATAVKAAYDLATLAAGAYTAADHAQTKSGTSSTASGTAAKVVTCSGFELSDQARIFVTFSNANTVADAITLNVNGTGAKSVYNQTGIISTSNTALFAANQPIEFRYDGTGWVFYDVTKAVSSGTYAATSSTAAGTAAKEATCTGFSLFDQARVFVTFANANTVAGALTLNVNGTGAKPIYNELGAVSSINIASFRAGVPLEFIYDDNNWTYKTWEASGNAIGQYFYAKDVKAQGVAGGSSAANTWQTRDINTIKVNRIGATLANNQVTVPAGTYKIRARVPGAVVNLFRVAIYNATSGTYLEFSGSQRADTSYADNIYAEVEGEFTFTVPTKIELRFWSSIAYGTTGFGYASNTPGVSESYSEITIWKM